MFFSEDAPAFLLAAYAFFILITGLSLGSFATALAYRFERNIPWYSHRDNARSFCPSCHHALGLLDLIPLASWVFLHGKCRYCAAAIPVRYPATELATMLLTAAMALSWPVSWMILPPVLSIPFLVAGFMTSWGGHAPPLSFYIALTLLSALSFILTVLAAPDAVSYGLERGREIVPVLAGFGILTALLRFRPEFFKPLRDGVKILPAAAFFFSPLAFLSFTVFGVIFFIVFRLLQRNSDGMGGAHAWAAALIFSFGLHLFLTGLGFEYKG